jgi:hypothetical protein
MTELEPETTRSHTIGIWGARAPHRGGKSQPRPLAGRRDPLPVRLRQAGSHESQDIRLPLGIRHDYPIGTLTRLAEYYQSSDLPVLTKTRIKGLRLVATDGPFTIGSGPLASGTTLALIMAMAGRGAYCDELQGDGAATLRERSQTP